MAGPLPGTALQVRRQPGLDGRDRVRARSDGRRRLDRPQGSLRRHGRRHAGRPGALPPLGGGISERMARGSRPHRGDEADHRAPQGPGHLGRAHPLGRRHRVTPLAPAHREREAVAVRLRRAALRRVRLLRGARDRRLRRRPVGARTGARAHPAPGRALPPGYAERRRAARLQPRPEAWACRRAR